MKKIMIPCLLSMPGIGLGESTQSLSHYQGNTLCLESEKIYFSCTLKNNKSVSLCGDLDAPEKKLTYRYGSHSRIEMTYPQTADNPGKNFHWIDESGGSVSMAIVKFEVAGYHYNIYDYVAGGISVWKNGKAVFESNCESGKQAHIGPEIRRFLPKKAQRENSFE